MGLDIFLSQDWRNLRGAPPGAVLSWERNRCKRKPLWTHGWDVNPQPGNPIRVLIVDGNPLVCRALVRLLEDAAGMEVVATATDGAAALQVAGQLHPDVVLVDVQTIEDVDGLELVRSLRQQAAPARVVALGVYEGFRDQALAAGACRFLLKDCSRDELAQVLHLAVRGQCKNE